VGGDGGKRGRECVGFTFGIKAGEPGFGKLHLCPRDGPRGPKGGGPRGWRPGARGGARPGWVPKIFREGKLFLGGGHPHSVFGAQRKPHGNDHGRGERGAWAGRVGGRGVRFPRGQCSGKGEGTAKAKSGGGNKTIGCSFSVESDLSDKQTPPTPDWGQPEGRGGFSGPGPGRRNGGGFVSG